MYQDYSINEELFHWQSQSRTFIIPGVFSLLLALSMAFSSTYMLRGLGEEKENRMMEVLLSSVSHR